MPYELVEVNERLVHDAFRNMILNKPLLFGGVFFDSYRDPRTPQTEVGCNVSRFGYSKKYGVRFRGWRGKWELKVIHGAPEASDFLFEIKIPRDALIRIEFSIETTVNGYSITCTFILANPNPPSEKTCRTHEERVGFRIEWLTQETLNKILPEIEILAHEKYVNFNPMIETPEEPTPEEETFF